MLSKQEVELVLEAANKLIARTKHHKMRLGEAIWSTGALGLSQTLELKLDNALNELIQYDFYSSSDKETVEIMKTKFTNNGS